MHQAYADQAPQRVPPRRFHPLPEKGMHGAKRTRDSIRRNWVALRSTVGRKDRGMGAGPVGRVSVAMQVPRWRGVLWGSAEARTRAGGRTQPYSLAFHMFVCCIVPVSYPDSEKMVFCTPFDAPWGTAGVQRNACHLIYQPLETIIDITQATMGYALGPSQTCTCGISVISFLVLSPAVGLGLLWKQIPARPLATAVPSLELLG